MSWRSWAMSNWPPMPSFTAIQSRFWATSRCGQTRQPMAMSLRWAARWNAAKDRWSMGRSWECRALSIWVNGWSSARSSCVRSPRSSGWLWAITGIMLVVYLLIAIAFPQPIQACVDEITRRPVTTVLMGLLTKILVPFVFLILVATGVGVFVVPFLVIALVCAGMIGKIALLQYFGQQIGRQFNLAVIQKPLTAFCWMGHPHAALSRAGSRLHRLYPDRNVGVGHGRPGLVQRPAPGNA